MDREGLAIGPRLGSKGGGNCNVLGNRNVVGRGGQTFPKSTEIRNSVAFRTVFSVFFRPCFSVVAESVSEQLL